MKIKGTYEGKSYEVDVPYTGYEITYCQFIDFREAEQVAFGEDAEVDPGSSRIACVQSVCSGDIDVLPYSLPDDAYLPEDFMVGLNEDLSIMKLYKHLVTVIQTFKVEKDGKTKLRGPEIDYTYSTIYKGDEYFITPERAELMYARRPYRAGEWIEAVELERLLEFKKNLDKGNDGGALEFRMTLMQMAVILRKKDEKLPLNVAERNKFMNERAVHFKDLPLHTVLSVRDFFLTSMKSYFMNQHSKSSSKAKPEKERPRKKQKRGESRKRSLPSVDTEPFISKQRKQAGTEQPSKKSSTKT